MTSLLFIARYAIIYQHSYTSPESILFSSVSIISHFNPITAANRPEISIASPASRNLRHIIADDRAFYIIVNTFTAMHLLLYFIHFISRRQILAFSAEQCRWNHDTWWSKGWCLMLNILIFCRFSFKIHAWILRFLYWCEFFYNHCNSCIELSNNSIVWEADVVQQRCEPTIPTGCTYPTSLSDIWNCCHPYG